MHAPLSPPDKHNRTTTHAQHEHLPPQTCIHTMCACKHERHVSLQPVGAAAAATAAATMASMLGGPPGPGPVQDAANSVLGALSPMQLYGIMGQMRSLIQQVRSLGSTHTSRNCWYEVACTLGVTAPCTGGKAPHQCSGVHPSSVVPLCSGVHLCSVFRCAPVFSVSVCTCVPVCTHPPLCPCVPVCTCVQCFCVHLCSGVRLCSVFWCAPAHPGP